MFKKSLAIFLATLMVITSLTGTAFALGDDVDIPIMDDEDEIVEPEMPSNADSFEHLSAGSVKVDITASNELFTLSNGSYTGFPTGSAPSGDKWGMFTNFAYPTYKLVDGEYVKIENQDVLKQGVKDMLAAVRAKNPNAKILYAYGMMDVWIPEVYKEAVEEFNATDGNTYYTMINRNDCTGAGGHPTPDGHSLNAEEYIRFIENNIWVD